MASENRRALERRTDAASAAITVGGGLVLGAYASWIVADLAPRWIVFVLAAVGGGYALYGQPGVRSRVAYVCYALAALLLATPLLLVLPDLLAGGEYGVGALALLLMAANLLLVIAFAIPAALVAYAGYRASGGRGVVDRIRDRRET